MIKNYTAFLLLSLSLIGLKGYSQSTEDPGNPLDGISVEGDLIVGCNAPSTSVSLNFFDVGTTEDYIVEPIPFSPPYPFTGGTELDDLVDDVWTDAISLGFTFDFYQQIFSEAAVGTNGQVTFDTNLFGGFSQWSFDETLPSTALQENTIYGAYHDIDITVDNLGQNSFNYYIVGEAPFRALVANFYKIKHFGGSCNEDFETTQQIVLYEATNIIDVYIKSKPLCTAWNDGNAVIGIQNGDGTEAVVAPDRNTSQWEAYNEGWRFTPDGTVVGGGEVETITWYDNDGNVVGTGPDVELSPTETTEYHVEITYLQSDGVLLSDTEYFIVEYSNLELQAIDDIAVCDTNDDGFQIFDLSGIEQSIVDQHPNDELVFTYVDGNGVAIEELTDAYQNAIVNGETITIKAVSSITGCESEIDLNLVVDQLTLNTIETLNSCDLGNGFGQFDTSNVEAMLVEGLTGNFQFSFVDGSGNTYESLPDVFENTLPYDETITATVSTDSGCISTKIITLNVLDSNLVINVPAIEKVCSGRNFDSSNVHDFIVGGQDVTVYYTDASGNSIASPFPNQYGNSGVITFVLEDNQTGCRTAPESFSFGYKSDEDCELGDIPEGFSPNGNGINDSFIIENIRIAYPNFKLEFYNRWGNVVYTAEAGKPDWNGQLDGDGRRAPAGVYFYVLHYNDGAKGPDQGRLYLNR
ncbi:gliding motility-associated C-terminal domain-containing protein [Aureivirga marina]|uniref:gliding motility-associated C-terminal domain-containing protein n=1 Tax=Aureivirga marina TaxID=1182451 RepID=UPI0018C8DEE4|nr:gliding motility-associated C-terminal domain-containing protein [Aureivirga marina]